MYLDDATWTLSRPLLTVSSASTETLESGQVTERLQSVAPEKSKQFRAMYSSVIGAITTDPAAMVIPLDDHMVHRGHGVFDTALIYHG